MAHLASSSIRIRRSWSSLTRKSHRDHRDCSKLDIVSQPSRHDFLRLRRMPGAEPFRLNEGSLSLRVAPAHERPAETLSPELSLLAFQRRVLALAEDRAHAAARAAPLSRHRDGQSRRAVHGADGRPGRAALEEREEPSDPGDDGSPTEERLARVEGEVAAILAAQSRCAHACLRAAEAHGVHLLRWAALTEEEREALSVRCREEIHPGSLPSR